MPCTKVIWNEQVKGSLKAASVFLLLLFYTSGNIQFELLHQIIHPQDNAITHIPENEKDPCHRSIYHGDKNAGCKHEVHLTKLSKCSFCHILSKIDKIMVAKLDVSFIQTGCRFADTLISVQSTDVVFLSPSRAPPAS